jgi:predicted peptidase
VAYAEVLPSGQKTTAAIAEYDTPIRCHQNLSNAFSVEGRRVLGAYVNNEAHPTDTPTDGVYVVICLDPLEDNAATVNSGPPKHDPRGSGGPPKGGPRKEAERGLKPGPGPGQGLGPGQSGSKMVHKTPKVCVTQSKPILSADGEEVAPFEKIKSTMALQPIVDSFQQFLLGDMPYNLYIPEGYDPAQQYPLVMFLHDAEPSGTDPLLTLVQGIGAVRFASPADQKKHPCFVLAPELLPHLRPLENACEGDIATAVKPILDEVMEHYSIDPKRVYTTGQSGGCMTSCELNHRYPDLFAASLLVAGQWDADRMRNTAKKKFWICVSEHDVQAFPGMTAMVKALQEEGSTVYQYTCNAKSGAEELNRLAANAREQQTDIIFTVFEGDSVVQEGYPFNPITNHLSTWQVAYDIPEIRDWLLSNHN